VPLKENAVAQGAHDGRCGEGRDLHAWKAHERRERQDYEGAERDGGRDDRPPVSVSLDDPHGSGRAALALGARGRLFDAHSRRSNPRPEILEHEGEPEHRDHRGQEDHYGAGHLPRDD
jgi:hypothetical protein